MQPTSTWFALRNPVFFRIWLASVLSATLFSAQDVTATWLMHDLGASFSLSLMATATSTPLLLFALPAGIIADMASRRTLILAAVGWQAVCSALLAAGAWTHALGINSVLLCIFALGIGVAFSAPVWSAIVPDIVTKEELPSAVTLGGVQVNIAGIIGPALGGALLPILGAPVLIAINSLVFLLIGLVILGWKPRPAQPSKLNESFMEAFIGSLRYAVHSSRIRIVLFRNFLFSLAVCAIPALLPVIMLKELERSAAILGLAVTCVAIGSLAGAAFLLPYLRQRISPNAITLAATAIMVAVLIAMAMMRNTPAMFAYSAAAGVAWALAGSELWLVGQRVLPREVRGRMNAYLIMAGQGGIALGAILLAAGASHVGLRLALGAAAGLAFVGFGLGYRFSINFPRKDGPDGPQARATDTLPASEEQNEETIGYFINSLCGIAGYDKCAEKPDRSEPRSQAKNKSRLLKRASR